MMNAVFQKDRVLIFQILKQANKSKRWNYILVLLLLFFFNFSAFGQFKIEGKVFSNDNKSVIPGATIRVLGSLNATSSDAFGLFNLEVQQLPVKLHISAFGYLAETINYVVDSTFIQLLMDKEDRMLDDVIVNRRGRYRNRNNPAVELIKKVIENKDNNSLKRFPFISYDSYEKVSLSMLEPPKWFKNNLVIKNFDFVFENVDTSLVRGERFVPIYLEEKSKHHSSYKSRNEAQAVEVASKKTELDNRFVNNQNIEAFFNHLYTDIDVYNPAILILEKPFLSPVSASGPTFYQYYITDTLVRDDVSVIELSFRPRNKVDRLFRGKLYITDDGKFAIQEAQLQVTKDANLNWVERVDIDLLFDRQLDGSYLQAHSDTRINFGSKDKVGLSGRRFLSYNKYNTSSESVDSSSYTPVFNPDASDSSSTVFWESNRSVQLSQAEQQLYKNVDSLNSMKSFQKTLSLGTLLLTSYKNFGAVDIGPIEYMLSFNDLEGTRLRFGGRASLGSLKKNFFEGYLAYGLKDQRWKTYLGFAQSLNKKAVGVFPAHYVKIVYQNEINQPGKIMGFINGNTLLNSFTRTKLDKWLDNKNVRINHLVEFENHVSIETSFSRLEQAPAGKLAFLLADAGATNVRSLRVSEIGVELRWAPNEEFSQKQLRRKNLLNQYPVFKIGFFNGLKGVLDGQYDYQKLEGEVFKRVLLSQLGFLDVSIGAGKIWGVLPYPLLNIPNANQAFSLSSDAFRLLNSLEFVSDQYSKVNAEYSMLGFVFNKIPLIKYLNLREVFGIQAYYGTLRPENRPENNAEVYLFPRDDEGNTSTFVTKHNTPYVEYYVGLDNIFKVLKVQYIRRTNYLYHFPNIKKGRFQFGISLSF